MYGYQREKVGINQEFGILNRYILHMKETTRTYCIVWWWRFSRSVVSNSCDPMDCSLPGSSVHGILQAGILEWVAIFFPGDLPDPGIEPRSPALQADSCTFQIVCLCVSMHRQLHTHSGLLLSHKVE